MYVRLVGNEQRILFGFAKEWKRLGKTLICTDISKDGTLQGPNFEMLKALKIIYHVT